MESATQIQIPNETLFHFVLMPLGMAGNFLFTLLWVTGRVDLIL